MTYFCPQCWKEIAEDLSICPHCGADQLVLRNESFVRKLVRALRHPEPETPIRAASILGQLRAVKAIPELAQVMKTSHDPYIAAACAKALEAIGTVEAIRELHRLVQSEQTPVIVRKAVRNALREQMNDHQPSER
jgi:HEAT repeat protein